MFLFPLKNLACKGLKSCLIKDEDQFVVHCHFMAVGDLATLGARALEGMVLTDLPVSIFHSTDGACNRNPSQWKTRSRLLCIFDTMVADGLVT